METQMAALTRAVVSPLVALAAAPTGTTHSTTAVLTAPSSAATGPTATAAPSGAMRADVDDARGEELRIRERRFRLLPISDAALRADTIAGKFHPLHTYRRRPASSALALIVAASADGARTHSQQLPLTDRREANEAYLFGLLPLVATPPGTGDAPAPATPAAASAIAAARLHDHLLFFTDMQTAFDLFPFTAALDFIEMSRHDAMHDSVPDFRICKRGEPGNSHWNQLQLDARRPLNSVFPPRVDGATARAHGGICRSFNAGTCTASAAVCRFRHACLDCEATGLRRGHTGCSHTAVHTAQTSGGTEAPITAGGRTHAHRSTGSRGGAATGSARPATHGGAAV